MARSQLLNLDQFIYRPRIKGVLPLPSLYSWASSLCRSYHLPWQPEAPPLCLCSTAQHMKAICVKTLNVHAHALPAGFKHRGLSGWRRWGENNKDLAGRQNAYYSLFGNNSCGSAVSHTDFNYGLFNHQLLNSQLISKCHILRPSRLQLTLLRFGLVAVNSKSSSKIRRHWGVKIYF